MNSGRAAVIAAVYGLCFMALIATMQKTLWFSVVPAAFVYFGAALLLIVVWRVRRLGWYRACFAA